MFRWLATITSLFATGAPAMAQNQSTTVYSQVSNSAGYYSTGQQIVPADDDSVRLILQWAADQGGTVSSYPSEISGGLQAAEAEGWLKSNSPPAVQTFDKDGNPNGSYSTGFMSWALTDSGRAELANRNAKLGSAATRMAHGTQFVPGAGVVVYGAARRVPLTAPLSFQDGIPITR